MSLELGAGVVVRGEELEEAKNILGVLAFTWCLVRLYPLSDC